MQIQSLLTATGGSNTGSNIEMAKLLVSSGEVKKVREFITVYRLYLRMKMREAAAKEQI